MTSVKLKIMGILILSLFIISTCWFFFLEGYDLKDSVFQTVITVTTVGFGLEKPLSDLGKIALSVIIFISWIAYTFGFSILISYFGEESFSRRLKKIIMVKKIRKINNHIILCGLGRYGINTAKRLSELKKDFIAVDSSLDRIDDAIKKVPDLMFVHGDVHDDDTLVKAHIDSAYCLIAALSDDTNNMYLIVTAKSLNKKVRLISKVIDKRSSYKFKLAGCDDVLLVTEVIGQQIASIVDKPDLVQFFDAVLYQPDKLINEYHIDDKDVLLKCNNIGDVRKICFSDIDVVGLRDKNKKYIVYPNDSISISYGDKLFFSGNKEMVDKLIHKLKYE